MELKKKAATTLYNVATFSAVAHETDPNIAKEFSKLKGQDMEDS